MGLDLTVLPKPKPGAEAEFQTLWRQINEAEGKLPTLTARPKRGVLGRLFGPAPPRFDVEGARARLHAISEPGFAQLGAPVVGRDRAADDWLRARLEAGGLDPEAQAERMAQMQGYHVLDLVPPCDGIPVYRAQNGPDETSFPGAYLKMAEAVLGDLLVEAHLPMQPEDALRTGADMMARAAEFAAEYDVQEALGTRDYPFGNDGDPATWVHIADQAGRWYRFWGARGHGVDPVY
jgi:hypothetical protein